MGAHFRWAPRATSFSAKAFHGAKQLRDPATGRVRHPLTHPSMTRPSMTAPRHPLPWATLPPSFWGQNSLEGCSKPVPPGRWRHWERVLVFSSSFASHARMGHTGPAHINLSVLSQSVSQSVSQSTINHCPCTCPGPVFGGGPLMSRRPRTEFHLSVKYLTKKLKEVCPPPAPAQTRAERTSTPKPTTILSPPVPPPVSVIAAAHS